MERIDYSGSALPSEALPFLPIQQNDEEPGQTSEETWPQTTTSSAELRLLLTTSCPLICTFLLEHSFTAVTILSVGHIGKVELAATSIASLTANITGYAIFQGLASCLDTLCPAAYGSGNMQLVGLHFQRMVIFLWLICIPIAVAWLNSAAILVYFIPQEEVVKKAALYLQVLVLGIPGYAAFECGKRFMMAQGLFSPTVWIMVICAPLNCFLNWLFVWKLEWGFIGAPVSVVIVETLLPVLLALYTIRIDGAKCWNGFTKAAFTGWWPMITLAIPSSCMVVAEYMAFEIITLASGSISLEHLAAQTILSTTTATTFMIHFPISIAAATRISTLIGAGQADAAKIAAKVSGCVALAVGISIFVSLASLRNVIPRLLANNTDVIDLASAALPFSGLMQIFDALAASSNGMLRGLGKQKIGGWTALVSYYVVGLPISFACAFGLHWDLPGLTLGVGVGLMLVTVIELSYMRNIRWEGIVERA
ncbi:MATE efflux family protein, partial [Penicillium paradoxum]|uniref:MATE efflux family protein n=1 Tax=Penicillium paradoxum TaxID=176176 RepID=UPI002547070F